MLKGNVYCLKINDLSVFKKIFYRKSPAGKIYSEIRILYIMYCKTKKMNFLLLKFILFFEKYIKGGTGNVKGYLLTFTRRMNIFV